MQDCNFGKGLIFYLLRASLRGRLLDGLFLGRSSYGTQVRQVPAPPTRAHRRGGAGGFRVSWPPRIPHLKEWKWNYSICLEVQDFILRAVHPPLLHLSSLLPPGSPRPPVFLEHNNKLMGGGRRVTGACPETVFVLITSSWEALPCSPLKLCHCSGDALGFPRSARTRRPGSF